MESQFHTSGSPVWIWTQSDQEWVKGTVQKVGQDGNLEVRLANGKVGSYKPEDCPLRNVESRMGVEVAIAVQTRTSCSRSMQSSTSGMPINR